MKVQQLINQLFPKLLAVAFVSSSLLSCSSTDSPAAAVAPPVVPPNAISLTAPNTREDTSPIATGEIGGYRIYYGTAQGDYQEGIDIADPTTASVLLGNLGLPAGTYYFVVTTYDTANRESLFSPELTQTI